MLPQNDVRRWRDIVVSVGVVQEKTIVMAPVHECLESELDFAKNAGAHIPDTLQDTDWQRNFTEHALRHIPDDDRPVYPIALYADGVRDTRA